MTAENQTRRLLDIMAALRHPDTGCAWDLAQDFDSIAPYAIEEAYEVADAIAQRDFDALPDELGDLLLQVVYQACLAEEAGLFAFDDVAKRIADKLVRRHPHVFGDAALRADFWEESKAAERVRRAETGVLAGIPRGLPALTRACKLSARAARVGFDWAEPSRAIDKLEEETLELREELAAGDRARLADELGDVLFAAANVARQLDLDPEVCLRGANDKFARRFEAMEVHVEQAGSSLGEHALEELEALWQKIKLL